MCDAEAVVLLQELPTEFGEMAQAIAEEIEQDAVILETTNNIDAVIEDEWFQPQPSTSAAAARPSTSSARTPRLPSGSKNIKIMKRFRSPSPALSFISESQSPAASAGDEAATTDDDAGELSEFLREEQQRRAAEEARRAAEEARRVEWTRRAALRKDVTERNLAKAREFIHLLKGEEKSIRTQRDALRAQLRALDDQEVVLDRRRRSTLQSIKKHESILAKYKAMNI